MPDRSTSFPDFTPTAGELIHACAAKHGNKAFAVLGDDRLSYAEAEERSARLAKGLLASGAGKGTRVGLLAPNGPDWIVGWLAATRIGAIVALLNTYGKARELGWILRHADLQVLLTVDKHLGHDYLERLEDAAPDLVGQAPERIFIESHPYLRSVWTWGDASRPWAGTVDELAARGDAVSDGLLREVESEVTPADPMVVVYSSGSTSDPKGAIHSHGASVRHAHNLWQIRDLVADDVLYTPMPLFWVGRLQLHARRRHARRGHADLRGAVRAGRHPRAHRARSGSPRCSAGPTWPRPWPTTRASQTATCPRCGAARSPPCCPRTSRPMRTSPGPTRSA